MNKITLEDTKECRELLNIICEELNVKNISFQVEKRKVLSYNQETKQFLLRTYE